MITRVLFHRFKQFRDATFDLLPTGITLVAGGNNAGKSTILHGLAVWQFCRTALEMERGAEIFLAGTARQGLGLGDDEFSPINVPSLRHLWTNLRTQKDTEPDGYTLKIRCHWQGITGDRHLEFGLALSNDRLFVKTTSSNLVAGDAIPRVAYLPPFAGIGARETRATGAMRRRRIGEGLAGAVLRNLLLDQSLRNSEERRRLRGTRSKISDPDLRRLRGSDPWELLQATLRETFSRELTVGPFSEEYHSYINVEVAKGQYVGRNFKRLPNYSKRDLMVEGSGFLQWLSVYALAADPTIDVLLLDEPDAHLHSSLQTHLLAQLADLASTTHKQVLIATHSTEILRHAPPESILEVRDTGGARYLREEHQKVGLFFGLGSEYAPRIDKVKRTKRLLLVEGKSDFKILKALATTLAMPWADAWVEWRTSLGNRERKFFYLALAEEVTDIVAMSLRDRDDEPSASVGPGLEDQSAASSGGFYARKWRRRHIEAYLLWPPAIALVAGIALADVETILRDEFAIAIGAPPTFTDAAAPAALMDIRGKDVLARFGVEPAAVAARLAPNEIADDIKTLLAEIAALS